MGTKPTLFFYIDNNDLRHCTGLKGNSPAGNTGSNDKSRIIADFRAVHAVISAEQQTDLTGREDMTTVGMTGQHEIGAGICLIYVVIRLMVENDGITGQIDISGKIAHRSAVLIGLILSADDIEVVINEDGIVLKDSNAVIFEFSFKLSGGEIAVALIVSLIVVAKYEEHAVLSMQLTESSAGFFHILAIAVIIDEIADNYDNIGILVIDAPHLFSELIAVEGDTEVGISDLDDTQVILQGFSRFEIIVSNEHFMSHYPAV